MTPSQAQDSQRAQDRPALRVITGDATAEDIAAIVAVLAAGSTGVGAARPGRNSRWADPATRMRPAHSHGAGAWRSSSLPH